MSQATRIDAVVLPRKEVELQSLSDNEGRAVVVIVERLDELRLKRIVQSLPGWHPKTVDERKRDENADPEREIPLMLEYAEPLIEAAVRLVDADGNEVQAFWFDKEVNGALPGRLLSLADRVRLFNEIMRLGGWLGGAIDEVRFPDGDDSRLGDGLGDVETQPGHGSPSAPASIPWGSADPTGS